MENGTPFTGPYKLLGGLDTDGRIVSSGINRDGVLYIGAQTNTSTPWNRRIYLSDKG